MVLVNRIPDIVCREKLEFFADDKWWVDYVRRWSLERKLADADVTEEEQNNLLKDLERKETEYMRLQRHKMGVEDFELLTIIGRGAFGEVCVPNADLHSMHY